MVAYTTEDGERMHIQCGPDVLTTEYPEELRKAPVRVCDGLWAAKTADDHTYILERDGSIVSKLTEDDLNKMLSTLNSEL